MFGDFIGEFGSDAPLGHFLADSRVELAHLRSLADLVSFLMEVSRGFHSTASCRRPNLQRPQFVPSLTLGNLCLVLSLSMSKQAFSHFLSIIFPLFGEGGISFVGICL